MQTQNTTDTKPDGAQLEAVADAHDRKIAELEAVAAELEQAAAEALQAFEEDPSERTLAARDISRQKAANARAKAQKAEAEAAAVFEARRRKQFTDRSAKLRGELDLHGQASAIADRLVEAYADFMASMRAEFDVLGRVIAHHNDSVEEINQIALTIGGPRERRVALLQPLAIVRERIEAKLGRAGSSADFAEIKVDVQPNQTIVVGAVSFDFGGRVG